jgi:hypothetical protein
MRLPNTAHTSRPWRIHELAPDFELEDVWALPTPGGPDDLPRLVRLGATDDPRELNAQGKYVGDGSRGIVSRVSRALFELRWKLGELLGCDDRDSGVGPRVATLRDRLPADLRDAPRGPDPGSVPMTSLYLTEDEWATEMANRTVHSVAHRLGPRRDGWLPRADGGPGQAQWTVRGGVHGRDQAVPLPGRVPGTAARDRARLADERVAELDR